MTDRERAARRAGELQLVEFLDGRGGLTPARVRRLAALGLLKRRAGPAWRGVSASARAKSALLAGRRRVSAGAVSSWTRSRAVAERKAGDYTWYDDTPHAVVIETDGRAAELYDVPAAVYRRLASRHGYEREVIAVGEPEKYSARVVARGKVKV